MKPVPVNVMLVDVIKWIFSAVYYQHARRQVLRAIHVSSNKTDGITWVCSRIVDVVLGDSFVIEIIDKHIKVNARGS